MRKPSLWLGALLGGLTGLPLIALAYLGEQWAGLPFVPFDLFDWLARVLPGGLITLGIDAIVRLVSFLRLGPTSEAAKAIEQLLGILLVWVGCIASGIAIAAGVQRAPWPGQRLGGLIALAIYLFTLAVEFSLGRWADNPQWMILWLGLLVLGWGVLLGRLLESRALTGGAGEEGAPSVTRRLFLGKLAGGALLLAAAAWGVGRLFALQRRASGAGRSLTELGAATPAPSQTGTPAVVLPTPAATAPPPAEGRLEPAPGTRPEVTANADFYRIDINTRPPVINLDNWVLETKGLFDHPRPLTLADLLAFPSVTQAITLSCISNPIGGDLISTSYWTGVPLRDVLASLGLRPEAQEIQINAADGFYESVQMADLRDPRTLLVYGMNGETLPIEHGFPLRIYIPNRYGMKQPKWIVSLEAIDHRGAGYWVERSWSYEARPQILSMIDTVAKDQVVEGRVPVGGIAWAGDRGIQKVEVQVDDGPWAEAALRTPPLSGLTWVQWRYDWPLVPGRHVFRVRATDGTGALQREESRDPYPDGATGYHAIRVSL